MDTPVHELHPHQACAAKSQMKISTEKPDVLSTLRPNEAPGSLQAGCVRYDW